MPSISNIFRVIKVMLLIVNVVLLQIPGGNGKIRAEVDCEDAVIIYLHQDRVLLMVLNLLAQGQLRAGERKELNLGHIVFCVRCKRVMDLSQLRLIVELDANMRFKSEINCIVTASKRSRVDVANLGVLILNERREGYTLLGHHHWSSLEEEGGARLQELAGSHGTLHHLH